MDKVQFMSLAAHTRLGPYEITRLLGTGGTGEVYKAVDTRLNRTVAIKLLMGPDRDRLEREARTIAAVNDPHICAIYDIEDDYLVMEYVQGTPIKGPLPLHEALHLANQIASALETAHSRGIVHRDLKPANILVTHGNVKLLDFGHAKQLSSNHVNADPITLAGPVMGTAAYMSPDQAQGKPADRRSDIFSFGVVLYEILSGRPPFGGDTVLEVLNAIVSREPHLLETSPDLQRIVMRCLAKDPADRFESMSEVKEALAQLIVHKEKEQPSVAVLPFANLSANAANEYFSDGLTEELISELAQIPGLRVTARTSAFVFRKKEEDIRRIASQLGVQTVLEGSVRESGTKLRITAQLINASDGYHLWSKTYDREKADVFEIQDDIAGRIARALQLRLYHSSNVSIPAYEAYLKARYYLWKLTAESLAHSREAFEHAIALEPDFALAYSGYADYFLVRTLLGLAPASESMPVARSNARKSLDIDPSLAEAHAVLATVATLYDYDRLESERRFELAVSHRPLSSEVRLYHAFYYLFPRGLTDEAVKELEKGLRDDPLNAGLHFVLGVCLDERGQHTEAIREFRETIELDEHSSWGMAMLAMEYWSREMTAEALAWAQRAQALSPLDALSSGLFAGMLSCSGESPRAKRVLDTLGDGQAYGAPMGLAIFHLLTGEIDKATDWLEKLVHQRAAGAFLLLHSPLGRHFSSSAQWPLVVRALRLHETMLPTMGASVC